MKTIKIITVLLAILFAAGKLYAQMPAEYYEENIYIPFIDPAGASKPYKPLKDFNFKPKEYLQYNFEGRKILYVGKPLSELLKDCEVPVLSLMDIPHGEVMAYSDIDLYFEDERATSYRRRSEGQFPLHLNISWEEFVGADVADKRLRKYGDNWNIINRAFYETMIVSDVRVFGNNPSDMPAVPDFTKGDTTPCCSPVSLPIRNQQDGHERSTTNSDIVRNFGLLDNTQEIICYENYRPNHLPDSLMIRDLFALAKDSRQVYSINVYEKDITDATFIFSNGTKNLYELRRSYLKQNVPLFKTNQAGCYNYNLIIKTVPNSFIGYTFNAPTGYDLYMFLVNRRRLPISTLPLHLTNFFSIAYDGSVYDLRIKGTRTDSEFYINNKLSQTEHNVLLQTPELYNYFYTSYGSFVEKNFISEFGGTYLKWGFINGGRMQEEFLDVFRRLYQEGEHFSKEDAYNAAFAYVLEGRGIELYKKLPNETVFRRYNTTPVKDAAGKITGFYSTIWQ